jgi:acyl-CoA thioesterase-2
VSWPSSSRPEPATSSPLDVLLDTLDLEDIDRDIFRGKSPPTRLQRVFGGQVASQALVAAQRTVPDRLAHSLHAYFLRPGVPEEPIVYEVDRIRDGRSYTTRRVVGIQRGRAIFNLQASFQVPEESWEHQIEMPASPSDPATLPVWSHRFGPDNGDTRPGPNVPFDIREASVADGYQRLLWFRTVGPLADDPALHRCVLAYASDLTLLSIALEPQGPLPAPPSFVASLDHAMWFHRPFRIDEWMLYAQTSPSTGAGRGLCQGHLFTTDGRLAVTVVQEGALRP